MPGKKTTFWSHRIHLNAGRGGGGKDRYPQVIAVNKPPPPCFFFNLTCFKFSPVINAVVPLCFHEAEAAGGRLPLHSGSDPEILQIKHLFHSFHVVLKLQQKTPQNIWKQSPPVSWKAGDTQGNGGCHSNPFTAPPLGRGTPGLRVSTTQSIVIQSNLLHLMMENIYPYLGVVVEAPPPTVDVYCNTVRHI